MTDAPPKVAGEVGLQPHVVAAARTIAAQAGITRVHGFSKRYIHGTNTLSDHAFGLAVDFPCSKTQGDVIAAYCTHESVVAALGIKYVIWQQRIWYPKRKTWTAMKDRGSASANHMDHVHVSFTQSSLGVDDVLARVRDGVGDITDRLKDVVGGVPGVDDVVGGVVGQVTSGWTGGALLVGVKVAVVLAGLGLVVIGSTRLVAAPAASKAMEALT